MNDNLTNETVVISEKHLLFMFRFSPVQLTNRFACIFIGIPLNVLIAAVILRSRKLWSPRNIFWLAVTFFNVLALSQALAELCLFYLYQNGEGSHQSLCSYYSVFVGCPYLLLLTGVMLATCDRYIALAHNQFYRLYATPFNVSLILFSVVFIVTGKIFVLFNTLTYL